MLSIRGKTILVIIAIVMVITISTTGTGLFISQYRFMETVKNTLLSVSKITSGMLASEISRIKEEARNVAAQAGKAGGDIQQVLDSQVLQNPYYLAFSVVSREGSVLHSGDPDARPESRSSESVHAQRAFNGETSVTTTMYTPTGSLIMRIWAPIDSNSVLAATLPGLFLSEFVSPYRIWETGSIIVVDNEGVNIAGNQLYYRVLERHNFIEWGKRDLEYREIGEAFQAITANDAGVLQYFFAGAERLCAYQGISGTDNWSVTVIAPLSESPISHIRQILFICAAIITGFGIITALLMSNSVAAPFEKMAELRKAAEAASDSKTRFLANMSHEMRTPLNAIIGLSELELGTPNLHGEAFTNIEKIYSAGMTLLGIINDLLDISKIESGKLMLIPVEYDVSSMINDTVNLNIVRIGSKPVQFRLRIDSALHARLKGDELRVKQIFNNLLSNAFKYTDSGFVDWTITSARAEGNRIKITSTIRDTGIGILKDDQEKLFKDYYQANLKSTYYVEGTGLGLSITNNLIKLMDGSISVESEYRKGSSFTVEFCQEYAGDEVIGEEAATNLSQFRFSAQRRSRNQKLVRADMSYARVLVVDDVIANLDVARGMLKPYRINVDCVTSGKEAINRILDGKTSYDAIFMDHMMPGMDGIQAVRIIREEINNEYAKSIPIIALTANALMGNDALFLENGFQAFLSKPIDILRLDQILNQWVRDKKKEKDMPKAEAPATESGAGNGTLFGKTQISGLNTAEGLARFENDEESYLFVLSSFVKHSPKAIETAKTSDDPEAYRIAVHSLKGSSRGIGAGQLGNQAEALEKAAVRGDRDFINANNADFVQAALTLVGGISDFLDTIPKNNEAKPEKEAPDPELLQKIVDACEDYDIVTLQEAVKELGAFTYTSCPDLAQWVVEQANISKFDSIKKRIDNLGNSE